MQRKIVCDSVVMSTATNRLVPSQFWLHSHLLNGALFKFITFLLLCGQWSM